MECSTANTHNIIFVLVDALRECQSVTYLRMNSAATPKTRIINEREDFIQTTMDEFVQKKVSTYECIKKLSRKFQPPKIKK